MGQLENITDEDVAKLKAVQDPDVEAAKEFAFERSGQEHKTETGTLPYGWHLLRVRDVLIERNILDKELLIAALLHDVIKHTSTTVDEVREKFGNRVADIVVAVHNDPKKALSAKPGDYYVNLVKNPDAVLIALAVRVANVRAYIITGYGDALHICRLEHPLFKAALQNDDERTTDMWDYLDVTLVMHTENEDKGLK